MTDAHVVSAPDLDEARSLIGANERQHIAEANPAKAADHIPTFDADVPGVLPHSRQRSQIANRVSARPGDEARYLQTPFIEIDVGIVGEIRVQREPIEWCHLAVGIGRCSQSRIECPL